MAGQPHNDVVAAVALGMGLAGETTQVIPPVAPPPVATPRKSGLNAWWWVLIGLLVAIVLVAAAVLAANLFGSSSGEKVRVPSWRA